MKDLAIILLFPSEGPRKSQVTPRTAAPRASAGVAFGLRAPLAHEITRVPPAFGLSVEVFYK